MARKIRRIRELYKGGNIVNNTRCIFPTAVGEHPAIRRNNMEQMLLRAKLLASISTTGRSGKTYTDDEVSFATRNVVSAALKALDRDRKLRAFVPINAALLGVGHPTNMAAYMHHIQAGGKCKYS